MALACQPGGEALILCSAFQCAKHTPPPVAHDPHTSQRQGRGLSSLLPTAGTMLQRGKVTYPGTNDVNKRKEPGPNCEPPNLCLGTCFIHSTAPFQIPMAGRRSQELPSSQSQPALSTLDWGQGLKWVGVAESGGGSKGHLVLNHSLSCSGAKS